jgi:hypothetical protein
MSQPQKKLQSYAVPVTNSAGQGWVVYVLATQEKLEQIAEGGMAVMHLDQASEIESAHEHAQRTQAELEIALLKEAGGHLQ